CRRRVLQRRGSGGGLFVVGQYFVIVVIETDAALAAPVDVPQFGPLRADGVFEDFDVSVAIRANDVKHGENLSGMSRQETRQPPAGRSRRAGAGWSRGRGRLKTE